MVVSLRVSAARIFELTSWNQQQEKVKQIQLVQQNFVLQVGNA